MSTLQQTFLNMTADDFQFNDAVLGVAISISSLCIGYVLFDFILNKKSRHIPSRLMVVRAIFNYIAIMIVLITVNYQEIISNDMFMCEFQGALFLFSLYVATIYYALICWELYLTLNNPFRAPSSGSILFHTIALSICFFVVFGVAISDNFKYRNTFKICFIIESNASYNALNWCLIYIPTFGICLGGFIATGWSVKRLKATIIDETFELRWLLIKQQTVIITCFRMDSAEITTDVVGYYENFEEQLDLYNKSFYKSEKYKHPQSLRNRNIQVVPKIAEYHFDGNNEKKNEFIGVWHMEAMPAENIILTAVYVLDRNENIYGGDIIYKRHLFRNEWQEAMEWGQNRFSNYMQKWLEPYLDYRGNRIKRNRNYLAPNVDCGFTPLGTLPTPKGRCCVFPNYAIHKVNEMGIENGNGKGKRRIIVFFLIDPTIRIASSRDIPLINERGISYYEACVHRIKLMRERAQQKNVYNTGLGYSLCEH
eukprot:533436_1